MTEAEWRSSADVSALRERCLSAGPNRVGRREASLYGVALLRALHTTGWAGGGRERAALAVAERHADERATTRELLDGRAEVRSLTRGPHGNPWDLLSVLLESRIPGPVLLKIVIGNAVEFCGRCSFPADLLRDIFGNPFRPVTFSPECRTDTAVTLARQMYESRDFGPMPILADALQDAGCDEAAILDHCRGEGPHVRGCWVVDLVLGKQ